MKFLTLVDGKEELKEVPKNLITGQTASLFLNFSGSKTIEEMQQNGWALLDGTTIESQLVASGFFTLSQLAISGTTYTAWNVSYPVTEPVPFIYCLA
jgi:hypothetical protein